MSPASRSKKMGPLAAMLLTGVMVLSYQLTTYFIVPLIPPIPGFTNIPPMPTVSAAAVVTDDSAVHKKFSTYATKVLLRGTYEVDRPSKKKFQLSFHTTETGDVESAKALGLALAATYLYLTATHAPDDTTIVLTVSNGDNEVVVPSALDLPDPLTLKGLRHKLQQLKKERS